MPKVFETIEKKGHKEDRDRYICRERGLRENT